MTNEPQKSSTVRNQQLSVLLYHHVGPPGRALPSLTITPDVFAEQMKLLAEHRYHVVSESQVASFYQGSGDLPSKPVLITFDDAYYDVVEYAFPILERFGFSALVFAVTDLVGRTNEWDASIAPETRVMTAEQIVEWSKRGISFGSHTRTHPDLSRLSSMRLEDEIQRSGEQLSRLTGVACRSFSYPWGRYNQEAIECVRSNYVLAFTTVHGRNARNQDPHLLCRSMVQPGDSLLGFRLRLIFGQNPLFELRGWLAGSRKAVARHP